MTNGPDVRVGCESLYYIIVNYELQIPAQRKENVNLSLKKIDIVESLNLRRELLLPPSTIEESALPPVRSLLLRNNKLLLGISYPNNT